LISKVLQFWSISIFKGVVSLSIRNLVDVIRT